MRGAVFFERDGVLNLVRVEKRRQLVPMRLEEFRLNPKADAPLRELKGAGYVLIVTTNQPGLSRGSLSRRDLDLMHAQLQRRYNLDEILICPHDEGDQCACRKPKAGLLIEASFKWHLDLEHSFVVSDKWQDAQAAHVTGCTSVLLKSPWNGSNHHDFIVPSLAAAAQKILQLQPSGILGSNCAVG